MNYTEDAPEGLECPVCGGHAYGVTLDMLLHEYACENPKCYHRWPVPQPDPVELTEWRQYHETQHHLFDHTAD